MWLWQVSIVHGLGLWPVAGQGLMSGRKAELEVWLGLTAVDWVIHTSGYVGETELDRLEDGHCDKRTLII